MRRVLLLAVAVVAAGCAGDESRDERRQEDKARSAARAPETVAEPGRPVRGRPQPKPARSRAEPSTSEPKESRKTRPAPKRPKTLRPVAGELTSSHGMLIGFQDDPSFRWRSDRKVMLTAARRTGASLVRTTVYWYRVAPKRPQRASNPFARAYRLDDLDELVRNAQVRGLEVMVTIWGTPRWANGGRPPNRLPRRAEDIRDFARALAARYSGRHAGFPFVRYFSVWNEPNIQQFLTPQYDRRGRSVSPRLYARLYRAAYAGIKRGNPHALVAAGETSAHGQDRPDIGAVQDSHSPGRFARLLAAAAPQLRFDAWAQHPYPTSPGLPPRQRAHFPNVTLAQLARFGRALDAWFGRRSTPIWITEYGYQTRPQDALGVSYRRQASYAAQAIRMAQSNPRVRMFVWFTFRDDPSNVWESGFLAGDGSPKPGLERFAAVVRPSAVPHEVEEHGAETMVRVPALPLAYYSGAGSAVRVRYSVSGPNVRLTGRPVVRLERDGWLSLELPLKAAPGGRYLLSVRAVDRHGNALTQQVELLGR